MNLPRGERDLPRESRASPGGSRSGEGFPAAGISPKAAQGKAPLHMLKQGPYFLRAPGGRGDDIGGAGAAAGLFLPFPGLLLLCRGFWKGRFRRLLKPPLFVKSGTKNFSLWVGASEQGSRPKIEVLSLPFFQERKGLQAVPRTSYAGKKLILSSCLSVCSIQKIATLPGWLLLRKISACPPRNDNTLGRCF